MDIRCPLCGEPWDHDELHEPWSHPEEVRRWLEDHSKAVWRDIERAMAADRRLGVELTSRRVEGYIRYFHNAHAFRRFGCWAFGAQHAEPRKPQPEVAAAMAATPHPEEWGVD